MNCVVTRKNLHEALVAVSSSLPTKTTLPVLSNVLFEAGQDGIWMSGTDLDVAVRVWVPAEVKEQGSLTAPGKKLQEIAKELTDHPVELSTRGDQIELRCGKSHFKLNGLPSDAFPTLPKVDVEDGWRVQGGDLQRLIKHTSFAVSTEESRPILGGVRWELRDGHMRMVATNGHRLARMGVAAESSGASSVDFIVSPTALQQVQRLFESSQTLEVATSGNHLGFRANGIEVYTRLIDGSYPEYEHLIPKDNDKFAIIDKAALVSAVRRMAVVASDQTHRIRMAFESDRVRLNVLTPDLGEGEDELELTYEGDGIEIGFNAAYLLEVFKHMSTDEVKFTMKAPELAATILPVTAEGEEAEDYLCLVMPLRLLD